MGKIKCPSIEKLIKHDCGIFTLHNKTIKRTTTLLKSPQKNVRMFNEKAE